MSHRVVRDEHRSDRFWLNRFAKYGNRTQRQFEVALRFGGLRAWFWFRLRSNGSHFLQLIFLRGTLTSTPTYS